MSTLDQTSGKVRRLSLQWQQTAAQRNYRSAEPAVPPNGSDARMMMEVRSSRGSLLTGAKVFLVQQTAERALDRSSSIVSTCNR